MFKLKMNVLYVNVCNMYAINVTDLRIESVLKLPSCSLFQVTNLLELTILTKSLGCVRWLRLCVRRALQ